MLLYKYVSGGGLPIVRDLRLRFTPPTQFNDLFEFLPNIAALASESYIDTSIRKLEPEVRTLFSAQVSEFFGGRVPDELGSLLTYDNAASLGFNALAATKAIVPELTQRLSEHIQTVARERLGERIGILSLSADPNNPLLWSHYADSHRGFVVVLNPDDAFFSQSRSQHDLTRCLHRVTYSGSRPAITWFEPEASPREWATKLARDTLLTKSDDWTYEAEWRLFRRLDEPDASYSFVDGMHLFALPASAIVGVIVGARSSSALFNELRTALQAPRLSHVALMKASISRTQYAIEFGVPTESRPTTLTS